MVRVMKIIVSRQKFKRMTSIESVTTCEAQSAALDEKSSLFPSQPTIQNGRHKFRCRHINLTFLGYFSYIMLLLWQLVGSALYFMRAYYCCIKERHTTFRCSNFATFSHSQELELAWLISLGFCIAIFAFFLSKVPGFLGYSVIFRKAIRLPAFWSLAMLTVIEMVGFAVILYLSNLTKLQICLVVSFSCNGIVLIGIICVLNFTQVNPVKNYSCLAFLFCKLTLIILFVQIFMIFIIGSVQFAFKVTGLDDLGRSANFVTIFRKLREFPQVLFYYRMSVFFFHKLFMDNKNILSHCQYLTNGHGKNNQI